MRLAIALLGALLFACAGKVKPITEYATRDRIPGVAALHLDPALCEGRAAEPMLCESSRAMISAAFDQVTEDGVPPGLQQPLLNVTPSLVFVSESFPSSAFVMVERLIRVEWKVTDHEGELVWLETIDGQGLVEVGNGFTSGGNDTKRAQMALDDLFQRSYAAFMDSREIRRAARSSPAMAGPSQSE